MTHSNDALLKRPECREILAETRRRERDVDAETEPPNWRKHEHEPWEIRQTFGPDWSTNWFAPNGETLPESVAQRYRRALSQLVAAGLIETYARWSSRTTNIALTEAGTKLAEQITNETEAPNAE